MGPDQTAVITGASSDIGAAIAAAIASTGAAVCLVGRNAARLEAVAKACGAARAVLVCATDLTRDVNVRKLVQRLELRLGSVDALIHCAGAYSRATIESARVQDLDALYRANVRLPFVLTQALLPLIKLRAGQIVFVNSSQGLQAQAGSGLYASTKHALKAMADGLRKEVNDTGVRVLSVYPGRTATPSTEELFRVEGRRYQPELLLQPEDIAKMILASLQLPRTAEVTNLEIRPAIKSY